LKYQNLQNLFPQIFARTTKTSRKMIWEKNGIWKTTVRKKITTDKLSWSDYTKLGN
jgi:hypothetical protein